MSSNSTYATATERAKKLLAQRTLTQLFTDWELTELMPMSAELPTVRGWILDEFMRRDSVAFEQWMDVNPATQPELDSPRVWFKKEV